MRPATELAIIRARAQGHELTDDQMRALADSTARLIARALGRLDSAGEWNNTGDADMDNPAVAVLHRCRQRVRATLEQGEGVVR